MKKLIAGLLLALPVLILTSCDAPRLNPLDPESPEYSFGSLSGFVLNSQREPIRDAKVILKSQNAITYTDSIGYFKFDKLYRKNGHLVVEKENFVKDSILIEWKSSKAIIIPDLLLKLSVGSISGRVLGYPNVALKDAKVIWKNQSLVAFTDYNGNFRIDNVKKENGYLFFEKENLEKDSVFVAWGESNAITINDVILSFKVGFIEGYVKTEAVPRLPIQSVKVLWKPQNKLTETNSIGYYSFSSIEKESGWLYFEKNGYKIDSAFVEFDKSQSKRMEDVFLNSNPKLESLSVYSVVTNDYPSTQRYFINVQASVSDIEKDIDIVEVVSDQLNVKKELVFNPSTRLFEGVFTAPELKLGSVDDVIGKNFRILVKEIGGQKTDVGFSSVKRVIRQPVVFKSPANGQSVSQTPLLTWTRYIPGFSFKYMIEVFTDQFSETLVWRKENVAQDKVSVLVDTELSSGGYYWVIWCIDEFQNRSRSFPATFVVP